MQRSAAGLEKSGKMNNNVLCYSLFDFVTEIRV